jgi:anti-sigma regulatory factor (Ser/Thr protein kinase)
MSVPDEQRRFAAIDSAAAVPKLRALVAEAAEAAGTPLRLVVDAGVIASELATNALIHGLQPSHLTVVASNTWIRVEVSDARPELPQILSDWPDDDTSGGRGMLICQALAAQMWTRVDQPGKSIVALVSA